ncbi:N-acetyl-alpha-D-glucosaminyl L-malate synthase BshA [Shewanella goraebulensis]|uniref:N-acetyl-alpha-D-glucosaminyl L-malate synthase BshA n=1 Tax=Shewanella goraebulensis TaxID=3050637 RepID=UPI00254ECFAB|nr:N-acetyl-alpha-D-glucosaminyl L-malate synthase BshA [Shewanella goraebulensis]
MMNKLCIGIVCHPSIGGSGLVATQLGIGLANLGHEVHFIAHKRPFKLINQHENIYFHEVDEVNYPLFEGPLHTYSLTAKIVEVVEQYQLDLVHAHYSIPHSLCAFLASNICKYSFPIVTTIHGTDVTIVGQDDAIKRLNTFSMNQSTLITTVSNFQRQYIQQEFEVNQPINVVHNFIDTDDFTPALIDKTLRQSLAADDEKILMHVSNFRALKNTQTVVNAFSQLSCDEKVRLVLVGSGPDIDKIRTQCQQLNILDKVTFTGSVKNVERFIANADCLIQPSYRESFCMVILEAMACGVPTVSSNVDGIPEVVDEGVTGFMLPPEDANGMAVAISHILANSDYQHQLGQAGRERAMSQFNTEVKINQYLDCYHQTLAIHGQSATAC